VRVAEGTARTAAPPGLLPGWLADVSVELGAVGKTLAEATARGVLWAAAPGRLWLEVPGVARYLSSEGRTLTIEPLAGSDMETVARHARLTPLAGLCYQRGLEVWHAATAARDGRALVLAGDSGAGKSTLLAALVGRGWQMLGDELAPVTVGEDGTVSVLPTGGEVRLWPDGIERLAETPGFAEAFAGAAPVAGPRWLSAGDRTAGGPVAVAWIWRLTLHNLPGLKVEGQEGFAGFDAVGSLAFLGRMAHTLLDRQVHLRAAAAVASGIPHHVLRRPRGDWTVPQILAAIEDGAIR
jgi:hypothetical protein